MTNPLRVITTQMRVKLMTIKLKMNIIIIALTGKEIAEILKLTILSELQW